MGYYLYTRVKFQKCMCGSHIWNVWNRTWREDGTTRTDWKQYSHGRHAEGDGFYDDKYSAYLDAKQACKNQIAKWKEDNKDNIEEP
jgi:hypothetical protein